MYTGPPDEEPDDDASFREERERQERSARRNRASWTIVGWMMAAALALLSYDSGGAALDAHRSGRPWLYPACVSAVCLALLVWLVVHGMRRGRRKVSSRGPA